MEIRYQATPEIELSFHCENPKEMVRQLSAYQEILVHCTACGNCKSTAVRFEHRRSNEGHDFFGLRCFDCDAQLDFGQHKTGDTLFAKETRTTNRGWYHWDAESKQRREDLREFS